MSKPIANVNSQHSFVLAVLPVQSGSSVRVYSLCGRFARARASWGLYVV